MVATPSLFPRIGADAPAVCKANSLRRQHEAIRITLCFELATEIEGGVFVAHRSDRHAVPDTLRSKVGFLHHGPVVGEQRRIFLLHVAKARSASVWFCLVPT